MPLTVFSTVAVSSMTTVSWFPIDCSYMSVVYFFKLVCRLAETYKVLACRLFVLVFYVMLVSISVWVLNGFGGFLWETLENFCDIHIIHGRNRLPVTLYIT